MTVVAQENVYKMPKTESQPADEMRMPTAEFDEMMRHALGAPPPSEQPEVKPKPKPKTAKRKRDADG